MWQFDYLFCTYVVVVAFNLTACLLLLFHFQLPVQVFKCNCRKFYQIKTDAEIVAIGMELFSRKRWRLVSAQLSKKFSCCCSWTFSIVLPLHELTIMADMNLHLPIAVALRTIGKNATRTHFFFNLGMELFS